MDLLKLIEKHEAFVPHAYPDSEGYWTIGIGRMIDKRRGGGITREEALYLLRNDLANVEQELDVALPWWRHESQIRRWAMMDMAFNMGVPTLLEFKKTLAAWQSGDHEAAADEALNSKWARQVKSRALNIAHMIRYDELPRGIY